MKTGDEALLVTGPLVFGQVGYRPILQEEKGDYMRLLSPIVLSMSTRGGADPHFWGKEGYNNYRK